MCFGGGSAPKVTPAPATPTVAQSVTARSNQESLQRKARGASSTLLTSGTGLGEGAMTSKPTLLGQ